MFLRTILAAIVAIFTFPMLAVAQAPSAPEKPAVNATALNECQTKPGGTVDVQVANGHTCTSRPDGTAANVQLLNKGSNTDDPAPAVSVEALANRKTKTTGDGGSGGGGSGDNGGGKGNDSKPVSVRPIVGSSSKRSPCAKPTLLRKGRIHLTARIRGRAKGCALRIKVWSASGRLLKAKLVKRKGSVYTFRIYKVKRLGRRVKITLIASQRGSSAGTRVYYRKTAPNRHPGCKSYKHCHTH